MNFDLSSLSDRDLLSWLGDAMLQTSLLLAAVLLLSWLPRASSPARRHLLLVMGIACVPVSILAGIYFPEWQWTLRTPRMMEPVWQVSTGAMLSKSLDPTLEAGLSHDVAHASPAAASLRFVWMIVWGGGVVIGAGLMGGSLVRLALLKKRSRPAAKVATFVMLNTVRLEAGVTREVVLLISTESDMPMTWGLFRPIILLPDTAEEWPVERLQLVLRHEMAHIARHDAAMSLITWLAVLFCWTHPLMWLAWRRTGVLRERACDDHVVEMSGQGADEYAEQLISAIRDLRDVSSKTGWFPALALGMASGNASILRRRLAYVLRDQPDRTSFGLSAKWGVSLAALGCAVLLSGLCACRESNVAGKKPADDMRVYFLTDSQWRHLLGSKRIPEMPAADPFAPGRNSASEPKMLEPSGDEKLRTFALTIRTRLLENGITFPRHTDKEVLSLRDERTLLVFADEENHKKLTTLLTSYAKEAFIRVDFRVFTVPIASSIMSDLNIARPSGDLGVLGNLTPEQADALFHKLSDDKDVTLMSAPSVTARSGQRATIEVVREFIYPTEFDPPQIQESKQGANGIMSFPVTPTTPTAFEMRPVGLRMEVEPELGAGGHVQLAIAPEVTYFEGFVNYGSPIKTTAKDAFGKPVEVLLTDNRIEQPIFRTLKCNTTTTVKDGDYLVLGGLGTHKGKMESATKAFAPNELETDRQPDEMLYFVIRASKVAR